MSLQAPNYTLPEWSSAKDARYGRIISHFISMLRMVHPGAAWGTCFCGSAQCGCSCFPTAPPTPTWVMAVVMQDLTTSCVTVNQYPSEEVRRELGDRLGLTAHQVGVWFMHRRRRFKVEEAQAMVKQAMKEEAEGGEKGLCGPVCS